MTKISMLLVLAMAAFTGMPIDTAQAGTTFHPIDLSRFAKGWDQYPPDFCWAMVPRGRQTLDRVPFQMDGTLEITGLGSARDHSGFYPTRITGIPVGRKAQRLHLLHGTGYAAETGTPIAKLLIHYADGSDSAIYILYGVHTRNWWRGEKEKDPVSDPNSSVGWSFQDSRFNLRLYRTAFDNPHPDREIKSIDLFSLLSNATPVVAGLTLEEDPSAPGPKPAAGPAVDESALRRELLVRFLDKDGQPVAHAVAALTLSDEKRTFDYGTNYSNARGEMVVDYPANQVRELAFNVRAPDCLPTRFTLSNPEPGNLAREHIVKLETGATIGGLVRDPSGQPIAGARVSINNVVRDEVGQSLEVETDVATTDDSGRWSSSSVSRDFKSLTFKLSHRDFRSAEYYVSDTSGTSPQEGSKADLLAAKAVMVLEPGIAVAGTVTGSDAKPIAGAEVLFRISDDPPKDRFAKTDAAGGFKFVLMETGQGVLAVAAQGFSPQSASVACESGLKPFAFKLEPARKLKGRVIDNDKKPLAGAKVALASWNELPFPKWQTVTDAKGQFSWDSAPTSDAVLSITKDGYTSEQPKLESGDEEVTFLLTQAGLITGNVIDAETKEPIKDFQVILGRSYGPDDVYWERSTPILGGEGRFSRRSDDRNSGARIRLLIEAKGYLPQATPPLSVAKGWVTNDFALKKGQGPRGVIKLPNGEPASGVRVTLLTGDYTQLKDRKLERGGTVLTTGSEGKFSLPASYATELVAVSEQGYAEAQLGCLDTNLTLVLQPWGRIEGTVRNGRRPATNEWVMVTPKRNGIGGLNYDFDTYRVQADEQGRFVLTNVPPGERYLTRLYPTEDNRSWRWSHTQPFTVKAGEVTQVVFGGQGRAIIGKVVPNEQRDIPWQSGHHTIGTRQPRPPAQFRTREEIESWNDTPEVKAARERYRYYVALFSEDGSFRVEDVPPGTYDLNFYFNEPGSGNMSSGAYIGSLRKEFEVLEMPGGPIDEPLDLGTLDLVVQKQH